MSGGVTHGVAGFCWRHVLTTLRAGLAIWIITAKDTPKARVKEKAKGKAKAKYSSGLLNFCKVPRKYSYVYTSWFLEVECFTPYVDPEFSSTSCQKPETFDRAVAFE